MKNSNANNFSSKRYFHRSALIFCLLFSLLSGNFPPRLISQPCFIENKGQWNQEAQFLARSNGVNIWITRSGIIYDLFQADSHTKSNNLGEISRFGQVVSMEFLNSDGKNPVGTENFDGIFNFFTGNASAIGVRSFGKVNMPLSAEIDAVCYFDKEIPRYDLALSPHAQTSRLALRFWGADSLEVSADGSLAIFTSVGIMRQSDVFAYQIIDGNKKQIACRFVKQSENTIGFELGNYNENLALVIDPLMYSTYIGGAGADEATGIAVDSVGFAYVMGFTQSTNFPTSVGAYKTASQGNTDAFVTKISQTGSGFIFSTYLGGNGADNPTSIKLSKTGEIWLCGTTQSANFPVQNSARSFQNGRDIFLSKLSPDGSSLLYSTLIGGSGDDQGQALDIDSSGNIVLVGSSKSSNYPITTNATQTVLKGNENAIITKLSPDCETLEYSSFFGGSSGSAVAQAISLDKSGNIYVAGWTSAMNFPHTPNCFDSTLDGSRDAFIVKIDGSNYGLRYSTLLGKSGMTQAMGIAEDGFGNAVVAGLTDHNDFPTTAGVFQPISGGQQDGFVSKIDSLGQNLVFSSFLGGNGYEQISGMVLDATGNIYLTGFTQSINFPKTNDADDTIQHIGSNDAFLTMIKNDGSQIVYSTFLGGSGDDKGAAVGLDRSAAVYVAGVTFSSDFRITTGAKQQNNSGNSDAFVAKFDLLLHLLFPSGGEKFCGGNPMDIHWESTNIVDSIVIILRNSKDSIIASSVANSDKHWIWNIPRLISGGKYKIVIQDKSGNILSISDSSFVIYAPPVISSQPADTSVCPLDLAVFTVNAIGYPDVQYQWEISLDGGITWIIDPDRTVQPSILVRSVLPVFDGYAYRCRVFNLCDTVVSAWAKLTVVLPPKVVQQPLPQLVCVGYPAFFVAYSEPLNVPKRWQVSKDGGKTWNDIPGETNNFYNIPSVVKSQDGWFFRLRFGAKCDTASVAVALTIFPYPRVATHPQNQIVCVGNNSFFSVAAQKGASFHVQWQISSDGGQTWESIYQANQNPLIVADGSFKNNGKYYRAIIFNDCGDKDTSQVASLTVLPMPTVVLSQKIMNFGLLTKCQSSRDTVIFVKNSDSLRRKMTFSGAIFPNQEFTLLAPTIGAEILPDSTIKIVVRYSPTSGQLLSDSIGLKFEPCGYVKSFAVLGQKIGASLVSVPALYFRTISSCEIGGDTVISIHNSSADTIRLDSGFTSKPFLVGSMAFPIVILPGSTVQVPIQFRPNIDSLFFADVFLPYTAPDCKDTLRILLRGFRTKPILTASLSQIDFPPLLECDSHRDTVLTLYNRGLVTIHITQVKGDSGFVMLSPALPLTLEPGDFQPIAIRFEPNSVGLTHYSMTISTVECNSGITLALNGEKQGVTFGISAFSVHFSDIVSCQNISQRIQQIIIANNSQADVAGTITQVSVPPPFYTTLTSGTQLAKGGNHPFNIIFQPTSEGNFSDSLKITLAPCNVVKTIYLTGSKSHYSLTANSTIFDFGGVNLSTYKDSVVKFVNSGTSKIRIESLDSLAQPFAFADPLPNFPIILNPGDALITLIRFKPDSIGVQNDTLVAVMQNPCDTVFRFALTAIGKRIPVSSVRLPILEKKVGEKFDLVLTLDTSQALQELGVRSFRSKIALNSTMLTTLDSKNRGEISNGKQIITIQDTTRKNSGILATIPMIVGLGDAVFCDLEFISFDWLDSTGKSISTPKMTNGRLHITDIWTAGKPQLANPNHGAMSLNISPNPASQQAVFTIYGVPKVSDGSLKIFNLLGNEQDVSSQLAQFRPNPDGSFSGTISLQNISSGVHFCRFSTGINSIVRIFAIQ